MNTNYTNQKEKLIYGQLSYQLTGIFFDVHNSAGRYLKEKQYAAAIEEQLKKSNIPYEREYKIDNTGNIVDFLIDDKIILEIKAKAIILKEDFYQIQRYLQISHKELGLLVNFRNRYLKPIRIVRIDTDAKKKFV